MAIKKVSQKETMGPMTMSKVKTGAPSIDGIAERGKTKTKYPNKTGAPSIDGIAERGKTKTKYPKMAGNTVGNGPCINCK